MAVKQFVSLPAMCLGDWFSWYIHAKGENSMAVSGFGYKNPSVSLFH